MDVKEKEAEIMVSNNETALVQPQQYIPEKTDSLLIGKIFKRLIDILGGIIGTIVLIPLTIGIAIANLICKDNGPIFYSQYRMGKNGKLFKMYKYRSMVVGADEKLKKYLEENEEARKEYKKYKKLKHDARVTKVGEFIRKTSLDEFPQFINVLKGDMSLVGPRPGLSNYLSGYYENQESADIDKYLKKTDVNNLYLLPAGNIPPNPSELLVRRQMRNLLEQLKNQVDLIIIDGTPSKLVTDSVILSRMVDSTIIVSAHNQTRKDDLERVIKDIKNVGGNIAGVVYNKIPVSSKKYNQTYYYSSNVVTTKQQPDYEAERRKLQQRTQNALSQNTRRNGSHSEQNNRNISNNINRNNQNIPEKKENMEVPRALRNDTKDDWHKIIDEERQNKNF